MPKCNFHPIKAKDQKVAVKHKIPEHKKGMHRYYRQNTNQISLIQGNLHSVIIFPFFSKVSLLLIIKEISEENWNNASQDDSLLAWLDLMR